MKKLVSFVEIPAGNFERAVNFYNNVFSMELQVFECGPEEKMACFPDGEGAVSFSRNFNPSQDGLLVSFNVPDSIGDTIARIEEGGGRVIIPKTKIMAEGRGYFAVVTDCEGNRIGLYEE